MSHKDLQNAKLAINRLVPTSMPVILIIERDKEGSTPIAESFSRRGYFVLIERNFNNAKIRLDLWNRTGNPIQLALVSENVSEQETGSDYNASFFISMLHKKYKKIKTILIADSDTEIDELPETKAAVIKKPVKDIELLTEIVDDSFNYSQEAIKEHIEKVNASENLRKRKEELIKYNKSLNKEYDTHTLLKAKQIRHKTNKVICSRLLEVFKSKSKYQRKRLWKESKHHFKVLKFDLKFPTLRKIYKYYIDNRSIQEALDDVA